MHRRHALEMSQKLVDQLENLKVGITGSREQDNLRAGFLLTLTKPQVVDFSH